MSVLALAIGGCGSPKVSTTEVQEVTTPVSLRVDDQKGDKWNLALDSMVEAAGLARDPVRPLVHFSRRQDVVTWGLTRL